MAQRRIAEIEVHKVKTGETLDSVAEANGLTKDELAKFNFDTSEPAKVNQHLSDDVGCTKKDAKGNFVFDDGDDPGIILVPREFKRSSLATDQRHTLRVLPLSLHKNLYDCQRNFLIVYGDPGLIPHSAGRCFELAAKTHEEEIRTNKVPGAPLFTDSDNIIVAHVSNVNGIVSELAVGNVVYLAYFGHGTVQALNIGEGFVPDSNLSNINHENNTPATAIPKAKFRSEAQVRLFGCNGGTGDNSPAQQIADHLSLPVYAYSCEGGTIYTTDSKLGHGNRNTRQSDIEFKVPNDAKNVWMVPANGPRTFQRF